VAVRHDVTSYLHSRAAIGAGAANARPLLRGFNALGETRHLVNPGTPRLAGDVEAGPASVVEPGGFAVAQEAVPTGRHGFMGAMRDAPDEVRARFTEDIRAALTAEDGRDVTVSVVERLVPEVGPLSVRVEPGQGVWGGAVNPNEVVRMDGLEGVSDEVSRDVVRKYMAVNGIVRG